MQNQNYQSDQGCGFTLMTGAAGTGGDAEEIYII